MYRIEMLPARQGDCLWIEYGSETDPSRVLIDGGVIGSYDALREKILAIPAAKRVFELIVVTHVDRDHIEGLIKLLNDASLRLRVRDIWYNGWKHVSQPDELGALQGEFLSAIIEERGLPWNRAFGGKAAVTRAGFVPHNLEGGMEITLLSPTAKGLGNLRSLWKSEVEAKGIDPGDTEAALDHMYEHRTEFLPDDVLGDEDEVDVEQLANSGFRNDSSKANASSIAFLAAYDGRSCVFAGDAHAPVVETSVRQIQPSGQSRLSVDALKVAHHGGKSNLSVDLLNVLDVGRYLISTDGSYFRHPHHETMARIIRFGGCRPAICFNYRSEHNQLWDDPDLKAEHQFLVEYPKPGREGLSIELQA